MKPTILIITLLLLITSCTTQRRCNRLFPPERWESTEIETVRREQVITLRIDEIRLQGGKPVYIDTTGAINSQVSRLETEHAVSEAWVKDSELKHWLNQKGSVQSDTIYITDTVIKKEKGEIREVNRLRWWQKVLMYIGGLTFAGFGYWVFRQFRG